MGILETMRVQNPAPWTGETGLHHARPGPGERAPHLAEPFEARTPQEALNYIEILYQSGRMKDLAGLLRRSPVFREAWLRLQQSSQAGLKVTAEDHDSLSRGKTQLPDNLPVPYAFGPDGTVSSVSGPAGFKAIETGSAPEMATAALGPGSEPGLLATGGPNRRLSAALQAYQRQDRQYAQNMAGASRLSLWV